MTRRARLSRVVNNARPNARRYGWGLIDQGFSSATNLALTVLAARITGARGVGILVIGFTAYLLGLSLQRALITDPQVIHSARRPASRSIADPGALTCVVVAGVAWSAAIALLGLALPGDLGRGLLLFSPWLLPALLQDLWRALLFREERGAHATLNDGLWAAGMALALPLPLLVRTPWSVAACWGIGASLAALLGFAQVRIRPSRIAHAWAWWRREASALGRWLTLETVVSNLSGQVLILGLAGILGDARLLGGFRAVQSLFSPLSLLAPSVGLPGLPAISRSLSISYRAARSLATSLSVAVAVLTLGYAGLLALGRTQLLTGLFGPEFGRFGGLVLPVAVGQAFSGAAVGFTLLVKAEGRGRALAGRRVLVSLTAIALGWGSAAAGGLTGAVWGLAGSSALALVSLGALVAWRRESEPADAEAAPDGSPIPPYPTDLGSAGLDGAVIPASLRDSEPNGSGDRPSPGASPREDELTKHSEGR